MDVRMAENVLLAIKRLLVSPEWGYAKREVNVDTEKCVLSVGGSDVVQSKVENSDLKLIWSDGSWETWEELQQDEDFMKIQRDIKEKLARSKSNNKGKKGKGWGKRPE